LRFDRLLFVPVKVALVTTPPSVRSDVGSYAWSLVPHLARNCELEVFVASELSGTAADGTVLRNASALAPRDFDHVLYQIGNEAQSAFMLPILRALGGTVVLHAWSLRDLSVAAYPALSSSGWSAVAAALREGGMRDARKYFANEGARVETVLNRSVVRGGDAFIVHDHALKTKILVDRNAPTPVAVLPRDSCAELAVRYIEFLEVCPAPRSKKKSLIRAMVEASDRRRAEARVAKAIGGAPEADGGLDFIDG
jgi:hypothetical protein